MTDKKTVLPPHLIISHLQLFRARREAAIAETLEDLDTLQESHRKAEAHLDKLTNERDQIDQAIRLLQ